MTTDFSLMDIMGNFTGGAVSPDMGTDFVSTATTKVSETPETKKSFINPKYALKTTAVAPEAAPTAVPAVPSSAAYNASIAQQESGNRPDIGYHDRTKSTAFGPYGTTAAGWQDARKVNPSLPADITQATPEQLTAGQDAYTQQNAKYLQSYGVPVNENTLSAAHLLGAKGLSDFQKTGYLSPQAIAANGGEENLRRIVNARLGGQAAPASGAAQQPVPEAAPVSPEQAAQQPTEQPFTGQGLKIGGQTQGQLEQQKQFGSILNSNSQEGIAKLAFDPTTPPDVQRAALDKLHGTMAMQQGMEKAQRVVDSLGSNPTPQALNKAMNDKDTGSYFKVLLFQALGWTGKAKQELNKIMPDVTYTGMTMPDGNTYNVKLNKDTGETMAAWDSQGQMITDPAKLGEIAAGGVNPATAKSFLMPQTSGSPVTKTINGQLVNGIQIYDPVRKSFYVQYGNQRDTNPQGWTSATQNADQQAMLAKQKAQIDLWKRFQNASTEAKFRYIEDTNKALVSQFGANAPLITPSDMGLQSPELPATAGGQPQAGTAVAPVAPSTGVQAAPIVPGTPAATGQIPAAPAVTAPGGRPTLQSIQQQEEERKKALGVTTAEQETFVKAGGAKEQIATAAGDAAQVANARRQQLDIIKKNPSMLNIMNGSGTQYDQARNIIVRLASGAYGNDEKEQLYKDIKATGMNQGEQAALIDFANLNTTINAKTLKLNSGAGSISNAEQQANKDANIGNVDRIPAYASLSGLYRSQFASDLTASKQAFLDAHPEIKTASQFQSAWQKEESTRLKGYQGVARARLEAIGTPPPTGASANELAAYKDRVFRAFEAYPSPTWDPNTNTWSYGTANAKRAAMKQILGQ